MTTSDDQLPYWQVNVPEGQRSSRCPDYLLNLSAKDVDIISTPDSQYRIQTWDEVCRFVRSNQLELFQRRPSQLRRYRKFVHGLVREHGSIARFVLTQRLGWEKPLRAEGSRPFECEGDLKILHNDWPYGIDPEIVHLVVWTKFRFEEDPDTGDLTERARQEIDAFVTRVFCSRVPVNQVRKPSPQREREREGNEERPEENGSLSLEY